MENPVQLWSRKVCRSISSALVLALAVICGLLSGVPSAQTRENSRQIWHLKQKHVDRGDFDLYIASDRVKVVSPQGYKFIVAAPDWTVHCFRDETKLQYLSPLSDFSGLQMGNPMIGAGLSGVRLLRSGKGEIQGHPYTSYTSRRNTGTVFAGSDKIITDPHVVDFIARFYHTPNPGSVPLFYYYEHRKRNLPDPRKNAIQVGPDIGVDFRSGLIKEIVLLSCGKESYRAADFEVPTNYARTKELTQVIYTGAQKDELAEVIGGIGFMSEKTRKMDAAVQAGKGQPIKSAPGSH
ncbi:MAG: hypothetical protein HY986_25065 [Candidatus Melainabacteria bacterium]|nr:hypothetical protein [Candidatus Melainabacteria bacterium]